MEPRFWIIHSYGSVVTINCSIAIMIATFVILLVIMLLDTMLALVDPEDVDQIAFVDDRGIAFLGPIGIIFELNTTEVLL